MAILSSFEVLAQSLIPSSALPPAGGGIQAPIPFVVQAYFVEVSLPTNASGSVTFSLEFQETTNFTQGAGSDAVMAQYIDANGDVVSYQEFKSNGFSFLNQTLLPGKTQIYSIQVMSEGAMAMANSQSGTGWRGLVNLNAPNNCGLVASPTHRQIYFTSDDLSKADISNSVVYSIPTASGTTQF